MIKDRSSINLFKIEFNLMRFIQYKMPCLLCTIKPVYFGPDAIYCNKCHLITQQSLGYKKTWKCLCGKIVKCGYNRGVITNHLKCCGIVSKSV